MTEPSSKQDRPELWAVSHGNQPAQVQTSSTKFFAVFRSLLKLLVLLTLILVSLWFAWNLPANRYELKDNRLLSQICQWLAVDCQFSVVKPYLDVEKIKLKSVELYATPSQGTWILSAVLVNEAVRSQPMPVVKIRFYDSKAVPVAEDTLLPSEYAPNSVFFGSNQIQKIEIRLKNVPSEVANYKIYIINPLYNQHKSDA